jgi:hypothetical protein
MHNYVVFLEGRKVEKSRSCTDKTSYVIAIDDGGSRRKNGMAGELSTGVWNLNFVDINLKARKCF